MEFLEGTVGCRSTSAGTDESRRRDAGGRFVPGNAFARQQAVYLRIMLEAATAEKMRAVFEMLMDKAAAGSIEAAKLVLRYVIGKDSSQLEFFVTEELTKEENDEARERRRAACEHVAAPVETEETETGPSGLDETVESGETDPSAPEEALESEGTEEPGDGEGSAAER